MIDTDSSVVEKSLPAAPAQLDRAVGHHGAGGDNVRGPAHGMRARGKELGTGGGDHVRHPAGQPTPGVIPGGSYDANPGQRLTTNEMFL